MQDDFTFPNFSEVWDRVCGKKPAAPTQEDNISYEEKAQFCMLKLRQRGCAVRYLPKF